MLPSDILLLKAPTPHALDPESASANRLTEVSAIWTEHKLRACLYYAYRSLAALALKLYLKKPQHYYTKNIPSLQGNLGLGTPRPGTL